MYSLQKLSSTASMSHTPPNIFPITRMNITSIPPVKWISFYVWLKFKMIIIPKGLTAQVLSFGWNTHGRTTQSPLMPASRSRADAHLTSFPCTQQPDVELKTTGSQRLPVPAWSLTVPGLVSWPRWVPTSSSLKGSHPIRWLLIFFQLC